MNYGADYIKQINQYFQDPNSSEHSYRKTFENYFKEIFPRKEGYFTQQNQKIIKVLVNTNEIMSSIN